MEGIAPEKMSRSANVLSAGQGSWKLKGMEETVLAEPAVSSMSSAYGQMIFVYSISSRLLPPVRCPQMSRGMTGRKKRKATEVKMPINP